MRRTLLSVTVLTLLLVSGGAVTAQEGTEDGAAEPSPAPDCIVLGTVPPVEQCGEVEPVEALLPIADYWTLWADHKQISRGRTKHEVTNAKQANKKVPFYRRLVGIHNDELSWLANHRPAACYGDEYEEWRSTVADLHASHKQAIRFARAGKAAGLGRAGKQERAAMRRLDRLVARVADCGPSMTRASDATMSRSPFVGSWVTRGDVGVQKDGFVEQGRVTMKIDRNGGYLLRRPKAGFCRTLGFGYVPLTIQGSGQYSAAEGHRFYTSGRMHCWPKRGGRQPIGEPTGEWWYHPSHDVLARDASCFWRKHSGSPANCRALYRGLPLPAEGDPADEAEAPPAGE